MKTRRFPNQVGKGLVAVLAASFVLAAATFVAGCTDDSSDDLYIENNRGSGGGAIGEDKSVDITVNSVKDVINFAPKTAGGGHAAKTIIPTATTTANYNFFLCYTAKIDTNITDKVKQITLTPPSGGATTTGTYSLDLPVDVYKMTLYAVPQTDMNGTPSTITDTSTVLQIEQAAAMRSYAVVDMRYQTKVSFMLTPDGLSGKGTYSLTIVAATDFNVPDSGYSIDAALYPMDGDVNTFVSGTKKTLAVTTGTPPALNTFDTTVGGTPSVPANELASASTGIACGTYNVKVAFKNTATQKNFVYAETVVILANQKTTGTVTVPDILNKAPNPPQNFIAGYNPPNGAMSSVYQVEFAWADTSYRETGFELDLMRVDDDTTATYPVMPTKASEWTTLKTNYTAPATTFDAALYAQAGHDVLDGVKAWNENCENVTFITLNSENLPMFGSSMAGTTLTGGNGGSLGANSDHLIIKLPLEHRYVARIRAVNDAGGSEYCYLTLPATAGALKTTAFAAGASFTDAEGVAYKSDVAHTAYTIILGKTPFDTGVNTVNLYRISYNIGDGAFIDITASAAPATAVAPVLTQFHSQYTTVTAGTPPTGAASTTNTKLLTPDSKLENTSATPSVPAVTGVDNDAQMLGISSGGPIKLQLKSGAGNAFWKCWSYESADSGTAYSQASAPAVGTQAGTTAAPITPSGLENDLYTGYKNLDLFATYNGGATISGSGSLLTPNEFELKEVYVTMHLKNGATTSSYSYGTAPNVFADGSTLDHVPRTGTIVVDRSLADRLGFTVDTTTPAFEYNSVEMQIVSVGGGQYSRVVSTTAGKTKSVESMLPSSGKYVVHIYARKGTQTFEVANPMTLDLILP